MVASVCAFLEMLVRVRMGMIGWRDRRGGIIKETVTDRTHTRGPVVLRAEDMKSLT